MKFDVIIGNPPYQLSDGGFCRSATPIYNKFVHQAKKLNPRYLVMIIPSRWFAGGKGLDAFIAEMLNDDRIKKLVDFEEPTEIFPNVKVAGGVCYFLWDSTYHGPCEVVNIFMGQRDTAIRMLNEFPVFVRYNKATSIVRKVLAKNEKSMSEQVSVRSPFGLHTFERPQKSGDLILRWRNGEGPYPKNLITVGTELIDKWKVITSYVANESAGNPGPDGKRRVFSKIDILPPGTICTETYLVVGAYDSRKHAENLVAYMKTKLFRFLVSQFMYSHHITRGAYAFVPILDMDTEWTDEMLYERYGLTEEEIKFIESKIRDYQ